MAARPLRIGILAIVAFAAGLVLARAFWSAPSPPPQAERGTIFPSPRALPALELTDHDGRPLAPDRFTDRWTLVFFGFTNCPDICPTTLATLAQVKRQLADLPAEEQPGVLLVSVDPERDDPERLAAYVKFFDASFVGATGSKQAVADAAAAFGVPFAKVSLPEGGYTMDHGSGVFVVGPTGGIVAYLSGRHDAAITARDYRKVVEFAGNGR